MASYWDRRKTLDYYKVAKEFVMEFCEDFGDLLDVGGGQCEYIYELPFVSKLVLDPNPKVNHFDQAETIHEEFMDWDPTTIFDCVMCLQVLEHVPDPSAFAAKLLSIGKIIVVSVPYEWPDGLCSEHIQDPVSEEDMETWFGKIPIASIIVRGRKRHRLVQVYEGNM